VSNRIKLKGTTERSFDLGLTNKQTFDASNLTANRTWILPDSAGSNNFVLSTDGAGNLSWVAQTGGGGNGSPGGNTTEVQFNDSGTFGGDPAFTWDKTNNILNVDNIASVDGLAFDTSNSAAAAVGKMVWDTGQGTIQFGLAGGAVDLDIGQTTVELCYNGTGSSIAKGKVVYIAGAQGNRISVGLANNSSDATSSKTFGMVAETFPDGTEKFVVTNGIVKGLNTSMYTAGDILWLGTNGDVTTTKPSAPDHLVFVGVVVKVNAVSGEVFVKVQNGYELDEIHDVKITTPVANSSVLQYDSANSLWINQTTAQLRTSANIGNIANINLNGNGSQVLAGNGTWIAQGATVDDCIVFAIALS
jgi:hypothetical protein